MTDQNEDGVTASDVRYASIQEQLLHVATMRGLGNRDLFLPNEYGDSKEPADLAWVADRTAVLFYCTKAKRKTQPKLDEHNFSQARKWLRVWSDELPLAGHNAGLDHTIKRAAVDYIIVVSVVECANSLCRATKIRQHYKELGLASAVSIPFKVLLRLMALGGNITDIIKLVSTITISRTISERDAIGLIEARAAQAYDAGLKAVGNDVRFHDYKFADYANMIIGTIKQRADATLKAKLLTTLGLDEVGWMCGVITAGSHTVGKTVPGTYGPANLIAKRSFPAGDLIVQVCCSINAVRRNHETLFKIAVAKQSIYFIVYFAGDQNETCFSIMVVAEYEKNGDLELSIQYLLSNMRSADNDDHLVSVF